MTRFRLAFALAATFSCASAFAQTTATSNTASEAASRADNAGNVQAIQNYSSPGHKNSSVKTNPSMGLPGFSGSFSSDYCGGTAAAAFSGGLLGISGGAPVIDQNCVRLRTFERTVQLSSNMAGYNPQVSAKLHQAATDILCGMNADMREIFEHQDLCSELPSRQPASNAARAEQTRTTTLYSGS